MRSGINLLDDLKKKRPFFLGVDAFDPHEPLDAPRVYQLAAGSPKGIEREGIIPIQPFETPYSWAIDVDVDDETSSACASCTPPRSPSPTSGSAG